MKIRRKTYDMVLNVLSVVSLLGSSIFLAVVWPDIPAQVPLHYNLAGEIDRWGLKAAILCLPTLGWLMYLLVTVIERFPQIWNTGVTVTEENRERVYGILLHLLSAVKFAVVFVFACLTVQAAMGAELPGWAVPVYLLAILGVTAYWLWRLYQSR